MRLHVMAGILLCTLTNLIHGGDVRVSRPIIVQKRSSEFKNNDRKIKLFDREPSSLSIIDLVKDNEDAGTEAAPTSRRTTPTSSPQPQPADMRIDYQLLANSYPDLGKLTLPPSLESRASVDEFELGSPVMTPKARQLHGTTPPEDATILTKERNCKLSSRMQAVVRAIRYHPTTPEDRQHPTTPVK